MFKTKQGFTLIELMVVIAIIGILAGAALALFPGANDKANDSKIKNSMAHLRTKMTGCKAQNSGNYQTPTNCDSELVAEIESLSPSSLNGSTSDTSYCADIELNEGNYWCIDDELHSVEVSAGSSPCGTDPTTVCP